MRPPAVTNRAWGAKFTPPRSGKVLPRKRLFLQIDAVPAPGAIWVAGPPGSGKSMLVASYAAYAGVMTLWYQVDTDDLDVGAFFHGLGLLVRGTAPKARHRLPRFTEEARPGLATYGRRFFRELFAVLSEPFLLVLDNLHELPRDAALCTVLATAIEELPPAGRMVLISRYPTPACFARLTASRLLHTLEGEALLVTRDETRELAELLLGKPVAPEFGERLHAVSEGWMAGIVLLLECWRTGHESRDDLPSLQVTGTFDYFASEIFARFDPASQRCLLELSLLPTVSPASAEQLCCTSTMLELLEELHTNNCFVTLHATPQPVYQFHALFREFLQARAVAVLPATEWHRIQVRAAGLLEREGSLDDALRLFVRASEWEEAVRLVLAHAGELAGRAQLQTLNGWLALLPASVAQAEPWLSYWRGVCALFGRPGVARTAFEEAHAAFAQRRDPLGCTLSSAGVIDAMLYEMGPPNRLDPWIAALEEGLNATRSFPSPAVEARALISLFSASMIREPGHPRMHVTSERLLGTAAALDEVNVRLRAEHDVAWFHIFRGEMNQAFALLRETGALVHDADPAPMGVITQHAIETWFAMLASEHERCMNASANALALARETGIHVWTPQVLGNALASAVSVGDSDAVARLSACYLAESLERRPVDLAYRQCILAWRHANEGDHTLALRYQTAALDLADRIGMPFLQGLSHLGLSHVLLARGDSRGAEDHLTIACDVASRAGLDVVRFPCFLAKAHLACSLGDRAQGLEALRAALEMGRMRGYLNAYWWQPTRVADLAEQALRAGIEVPYVQHLVRRRDLTPHAPPVDCPAWPWRVRLYTLGRLQLLVDDRALPFEGKAQRRPLELLLAMVAFRGRGVPEMRLFEALWPGSEAEKAHDVLKVTVARLRELLGDAKAVRVSHGCLTLDARHCWVDAWEFERRLSATEAALRADDPHGACRELEAAMTLYRGPFLQGDMTSSWTIELRERLRTRLHRVVASAGEALVGAREEARAVHLHERALEADPLAEVLYLGLIRMHDSLGHRPEAIAAFERWRRVLAAHGLPLSPKAEAARRAL